MTKAILFDFWGTLADNGVRSPLRQAYELLGLYRFTFPEFVQQFEEVFMTKKHETLEDGFKEVFIKFKININDRILNELIGLWNKNWMLARLYEDTLESLEHFKKEGYKLALISNTDNFSIEKVIDKFGLSKYFDAVILSYECGLLKTNPKMFDLALEKLGVKKAEAIMVGDSIETDIEGATKAGVKAVLIDRRDKRAYENKILKLMDLQSQLK